MPKQLVFIDDSGDPGFKEGSSDFFVVAAVLFAEPEVASLLSDQISNYRRSLGWRDDYEFKFTKIRKDIIIKLLNIISNYEFQIYAVYINKACFKRNSYIIDNNKLYNWVIKELLIMIPLSYAKIEIDGRSSKQYMKRTATYLRREIDYCKTKKIEIKFEDSTKDNLIQLADLVAGSIGRSLCKDKTDSKIYINSIKKRVVRIKRIN